MRALEPGERGPCLRMAGGLQGAGRRGVARCWMNSAGVCHFCRERLSRALVLPEVPGAARRPDTALLDHRLP